MPAAPNDHAHTPDGNNYADAVSGILLQVELKRRREGVLDAMEARWRRAIETQEVGGPRYFCEQLLDAALTWEINDGGGHGHFAACAACGHPKHTNSECEATTGYDHLNGDHECGCPGEADAMIAWLVEVLRYPFDVTYSPPPPIDHHALAEHWRLSDDWDTTPEEAYATVAEEAGLPPQQERTVTP